MSVIKVLPNDITISPSMRKIEYDTDGLAGWSAEARVRGTKRHGLRAVVVGTGDLYNNVIFKLVNGGAVVHSALCSIAKP